MLEYFKQQQKLRHKTMMGRVFVAFGRNTFAIESWINHGILKSQKTRKPVDYKEEVLLGKGIETFSEILLYAIVFGLPFWELYKGTISAHQKEEKLQKRLVSLDGQLTLVNTKIQKVSEFLGARRGNILSASDS